ncbi:MAG: 30S ribosomal protein S3 [Chloroflexi bacterium]|nr:MAG: 30S ribosomal protein S3 [Chloroflexota bacterium]
MGRKVHPYGFRLGIIKDWKAKWYAEGEEYTKLLHEDLAIRELIRREMGRAGVSDIHINRFPNQVSITIFTAKPGIIIGRKGANVKELRGKLEDLTGKTIRIDVQEVEDPETDATLIAERIVEQIERRISHRRAMKHAASRAMRQGAQGIKIEVSGRLAGAEMARKESVNEGQVPRHTLRADIDYAQDEALTTYGRIGVKVWVYKGEVLPGQERTLEETATATAG